MGKIKIHELAKDLKINSKELLEKAKELGIDVKSHLSAISEDEAKKLENIFNEKTQKKNKEKVMESKKEKKESPVIIRREVIISEENNKSSEKHVQNNKEKEVGKVEKNKNKEYNIVYRDKIEKPLAISELFGMKKKEKKVETKEKEQESANVQEKVVEEIKEEVKIEETKIEQEVKEKNSQEVAEKTTPSSQDTEKTNSFQNNNYQRNNTYQRNNGYQRNNFQNNGKTQYTNDRNNYQGRNGNQGYQQRDNNTFQKNGNNFQRNNNYQGGRGQFQNDRNNNYQGRNNFSQESQRQNKPLDEKGIDKNIKNIMALDLPEKENVREYSNRNKDKVKTKNEEARINKKAAAKKGSRENEFDTDKLKSLKQQDKLSSMFNEGSMLDYYDLGSDRGRKKKKPVKQENRIKQKIFKLTEITIPPVVTVKDLALEMKITSSEVIKKLLGFGVLATINNEIDFDTAFLVAEEFGIKAIKKEIITDEEKLFDESEDKESDLVVRPPVIVVMGHVDHGKTSLLDAIRSTNVIEGESGGITQHIGAYQVKVNDRDITFLDTPGHEAFTSMRARGAQITDIAILVVAANDGVMPQTVEAINHAKAAEIPIIVAVNKIDLEGANVERVKQELTEYELVPEEWGGDTIYVPISAKNKVGIDTLLEMVLLQADMLELKVNPKKQAKGTVIEARLDKSKGPIATMLVQRGTLDIGDTIVVGSSIGRIRTMVNDKRKKVKSAGPATPVEITGLTSVPQSGDTFYEVKDEKTAKHLIERRIREARDEKLKAASIVTLDDLFNKIEEGKLKQLNLIVKADVQGSVEAIKQSLEKLSNEEVKVKVIHSNVGGVTESDVTLAKVSSAIIIAFNVRPEPIAKMEAEKEQVEIKTYSVIYNAIEDIEAAMKGMLDPIYKEVVTGNIEVRQTFKVSNVGTIAGGYVLDGKVTRHAKVRVIRDNVVIYEGELASLRRFKDDVKEVASGYECGLQIADYNDIKEGDIIEAHIMEEVKR